ncbi:hypothetical protein evm_012006 [Chilo suppressalis]|nr:hypothetical protein evm_012006 [Chilo suppressalis]
MFTKKKIVFDISNFLFALLSDVRMRFKIFGALEKFYAECAKCKFKVGPLSRKRQCQSEVPENPYHQNIIKLATVRITPKLKLLSFRVSKNYLYLSFAKPTTDLLEFDELFQNETV